LKANVIAEHIGEKKDLRAAFVRKGEVPYSVSKGAFHDREENGTFRLERKSSAAARRDISI